MRSGQGDNFGLFHGWVVFDLGVPQWFPGALPVLPTQPSNKPKLSHCTSGDFERNLRPGRGRPSLQDAGVPWPEPLRIPRGTAG